MAVTVVRKTGATTQTGSPAQPNVTVPIGGTTNQGLIKASDADGDITWGAVGGGGGSIVIQEGDVTVVSAATSLDFVAADFDVTEAPAGEGNIALSATVARTGSTLAQFAATTSVQLAGVLSDETGSGAAVFATSPTLVTPNIGVATATTVNKVTISAPTTSAALTLADGKTLVVNNTLTFSGTDATAHVFPTTSQTIAGLSATQTLTNKTISGASNTLTVREADLSFTDITTANSSTTAHGLLPKLSNITTEFLRGDGVFATPAGSGDVTSNTAVSVDNELVLFNSTTGKSIKRSTGTGLVVGTSGVASFVAAPTGTVVGTSDTQTLTNKTLTAPRIGTSILDTNGNELFLLTATASAVNELTYANAATGSPPVFTATGSDTNISINLVPKGTGSIQQNGTAVALSNAPATLSVATALVRTTHGNRLLVCDTAATHTVEDDTTGAWVAGDMLYGYNTSGGNVVFQGDGTAVVTAETGHTLTAAAGQAFSFSRTGVNAWRGGALDADLMTIAGLTATSDNFMQGAASAWASRTPLQAGVSLFGADPGADRILFWDDSANIYTYLTAGTGLSITTTTLSATGTAGKHLIPVMAPGMIPSAAGGSAVLATVASAANQPDITSLDFDATTEEYAQFSVPMPESWNEGTLTFQPIWSHAATTTNFGVVWSLQAVAVSDDDAIAVAFGTAVTSTDTGGTTNDVYVGPESSAMTVAGTPANKDNVFFRIFRTPANASDTMAIDARLHGIRLYYTTNAETDA